MQCMCMGFGRMFRRHSRQASLTAPAGSTVEILGEVSSKTHPSQWKLLTRVSQGPRASQFPELARLFGQGSNDEKKEVLRKYLTSGENLESCEATMNVSRRHRDELSRGREELTVKEMIQRGFSEPLGFLYNCVLLDYIYTADFLACGCPALQWKAEDCWLRGSWWHCRPGCPPGSELYPLLGLHRRNGEDRG